MATHHLDSWTAPLQLSTLLFSLAQRGAQLTDEPREHLETLSIYTAGQAVLLCQSIHHEVHPAALALATVARHPPVLGENDITAALCWRSYRGGCLQTAVRGQHEAQQLTAGHRDPEAEEVRDTDWWCGC